MPKQSKAAFVRGLPSTMPAKEVVAKAKAAGLSLTAAYVYVLRSKRGARRGRAPGGARAEEILRAIALDIGLPRALAILRAEQARVRRLME